MNKLKIAIIYGGKSVEHGVSVNSAKNVFEHIDKNKFDVFLIGISTKGIWYHTNTVTKELNSGEELMLALNPTNPTFITTSGKRIQVDIVFPVLHGTDGEDGSIQGLIKVMNLPLVGTGVLGSAMSMNKLITKKLLKEAQLPVSKFISAFFNEKENLSFNEIVNQVGLPFIVKPASLGSSVGVTKVKSKEDFTKAIANGFRYDDCILIEEFIQGRELECAVLGNNPPITSLPGEVIINTQYDFYTFEAKYVDQNAVTIELSAQLDHISREKIQTLSLQAYQVLHCEDFARIDLFLTPNGNVYINEINSIPGFTNSSMFPLMWKQQGISFSDLITKLINLTVERFEKSKRVARYFESSLKF